MKQTPSLIKISASGNKFLISDERWFKKEPNKNLLSYRVLADFSFEDCLSWKKNSLEERKKIFQEILNWEGCDKTDGFIVLRDYQDSYPVYDFYNKDGSQAEMCGNAACCLVDYAQETSLPFSSFQIGEEKIKAVQNFQGDWAISLKEKPKVQGESCFSFEGKDYPFVYIEPGVPHAVLEWEGELSSLELKNLAKVLRFDKSFHEDGMNVSFYQIQKDNNLKAITFERGVEDFTLACGTGALAVAFSYKHLKKKRNEVFISMPGGDLVVDLVGKGSLKSSVRWGY